MPLYRPAQQTYHDYDLPAGIVAELAILGSKIGAASVRLRFYLQRFGSIPADERTLATTLGVTPAFLRGRAWPVIGGRLRLTDDGTRYSLDESQFHSDASARAAPAQAKSARHQAAAEKRWSRVRADRIHMLHASSTHASRMQADAQNSIESTSDASKNAQNIADSHASSDAQAVQPTADALRNVGDSGDNFLSDLKNAEKSMLDASQDSRARVERDSVEESVAVQIDTVSQRDTVSEPTSSIQTKVQKNREREPRPISKAWWPDSEGEEYCRARGYDMDWIVGRFRKYWAGMGGNRLDWNPGFQKWVDDERTPPPGPKRQGEMIMGMTGGKALAGITERPSDPLAAKLWDEFGIWDYNQWLVKITIPPRPDADGELVVACPTIAMADWIRTKTDFGKRLLRILQADDAAITGVRFLRPRAA